MTTEQNIKFIQLENSILSIQAVCPEINGIPQNMEMLLCIEKGEKDIVLNLKLEQAKELLKEVQRVFKMVETFHIKEQN